MQDYAAYVCLKIMNRYGTVRATVGIFVEEI